MDSGPGPELFLHLSCPSAPAAHPPEFWVKICEEGYAPPVLLLRFQACPSLIVAQSGGGDSFLFRPSKILFLDVAQRWSPFAAASGSVALSELCLFITIILM